MGVPQHVKNRTTISQNNSSYLFKTIEIKILKRFALPCSIAALVTIANMGTQPKCPLTDEWIKNMWCIHRIKYYETLKKEKILQHVAT